ncbi:MAG TPA: filamentous hemagglutinin family protein, partial [Ideonella sp.]|nr:filamentous hemagglutinin family protein [Ideonella sp.]
EVAIDRLAGTISGAGRIDVQAVRVYEGVQDIVDFDSGIEGQLSTSRMASDASNFIGSRGGHATAIAERLAAGSSDVAELIKVHSEAEVRATSDLTLATFSDWILPSESYFVSAAGGDSRHVGDSSVTLRAAGNLFVKQGIDGGLYASFAPVGIAGGTIQLVAGADLAAASAMATGGSAMDLVVGRTKGVGAPPGLAVRTTAGDISLAASGDIDLQGSGGQVQIYTSGYQVDDEAAVAAAAALGFSPFSIGAGDVSLRAGGAVRGSEVNRLDVFSPRILGVSGTGRQGQAQDFLNPSLITTGWTSTNTAGWSGLASTGGGDIDVVAGADVVNLVALAASSGYYVTDASVDAAAAPEVHRYDGGSVSIQAGRDVVNGAYGAGGETLRVEAGRDLVQRDTTPFPNVDSPGTRLYYENTSVSVAARRDLTLGSVHSRFFTYAPDLGVSTWLTGLDGRAALDAVASAGSLRLTAYEIEDSAGISQKAMLLPQKVRLAAPFGDVEIGGLIGARLFQQPSDGGRLQVLAGGDLALNARLSLNATNSTAVAPTYLDPTQVETLDPGDAAEPVLTDGPQFDQSSRESVQLVAGAGDLSIASSVASARPLRLVAGRDIVLSSADAVVKVQHQPAPDAESAQELSLLQAGRDILFNQGYMTVGGAGDVVLLAGRDIDLGRASATSTSPIPGSGLMAIGNTDNGLLPAESAAITLVAGLRADGVDYSAAVQQGFHALGAAALAARAGDVYALLSSTDGNLPALDSAAAKQFSALDTAGQLAQVRELLGQAAYDRALAGYVRGLQGNAALSDAQALAAFDGQSDARRDAAPGSLLAGQLAAAAPDSRLAFIAQVARQDTPRTAQGLQAWMKLKTGQDLALADAVSAFEALPLERQVSWLNQVLVDEVRSQGRAAAQASGFDAEAAYLRGYQAINTVFALDRPAGQIRLPTTQVKTLQSANLELLAATETQRAVSLGAITMMAPGGDINAGELGSSSQSPNRLGIVTVAGGDIAAVVRDDFLVNQSRVFSLAEGDIMLWASSGDIDAGRGAKTVVGAPAPVLRLDPASGKLVLDTSGSFTGSGIAVLNADSDLDLYAPAGAIDAGEAGIRAQGNVFLGAQVVRGADNLQFGGNVVGAPVTPATVSATANLGNAAALAQAGNSTDDEEERRKRRLARRNLLLEFLGFGRG